MKPKEPILILGGGINGIAVARELTLNQVPCIIVDKHDIAYGATSKSSRLIHGGLRYLEYADFKLVKESLQERNILANTAYPFVQPLKLHIPVSTRFSGACNAASRFLGLSRFSLLRPISRWLERKPERGQFIVRTGLWMYDLFAASKIFPKHQVSHTGKTDFPPVDSSKYRWFCSYYDGQIQSPERFVLSMLEDARVLAKEQDLEFAVFPNHHVELNGGTVKVTDKLGRVQKEWKPPLLINATGAWGDLTLSEMKIPSEKLFGGTKGSHFFSKNRHLKAAIGNEGLYAEAADGRPVFVLPVGESVMVGTTDVRIEGRPDEALVSSEELDYLLELTNELFPQIEVTPQDIDFFYCGVRPLPYAPAGKASSISRGHQIHRQTITNASNEERSLFTLIGGKLTTCRALGEEVMQAVAETLNFKAEYHSRQRLFPGACPPEMSLTEKEAVWEKTKCQYSLSTAQVAKLWNLFGMRIEPILEECFNTGKTLTELIPHTPLPVELVRWVVRNEWVPNLESLVNRRLLLLYDSPMKRETLEALAKILVDEQIIKTEHLDSEVDTLVQNLEQIYGKQVY